MTEQQYYAFIGADEQPLSLFRLTTDDGSISEDVWDTTTQQWHDVAPELVGMLVGGEANLETYTAAQAQAAFPQAFRVAA